MTSRQPTDIDKHIAVRLIAARKKVGLSQTDAANVLGVAFQQIGKIELGTNRISASNLYKLAVAYKKPVAWFYEGLDEPEVNGDISTRLLGALHGVDLARDFLAITSVAQRKALVDLAAVLAVRS